MSSQRIQVIKSRPRDRNRFTDLCGMLEVTLTAESSLHIGSRQIVLKVNEDEVKKILGMHGFTRRAVSEIRFEQEYEPFNLTGKNPTIPGSSIKGNVRSRLELMFKARDGRVRACFIRAGPPLKGRPIRGSQGWRHFEIWDEVLREDRGMACNHTNGGDVCLLCDLFGTAGLKGLIGFGDFAGEGVELKPLNLQYGIRVITAQRNSNFRGTVNFYNLKSEELGLLLLGMGIRKSRIGDPVLLGRFKYRRMGEHVFGRVKYSINSLHLARFSKPLQLGNASVGPGENVTEDRLDDLVKELVARTFSTYEGELRLVDEVRIIDGLR